MVYLAFIFHMHQPYYKNLLTNEAELPWVRLHGTKDYLDMVKGLSAFPKIKLTFNLVPSLLEQVEDYAKGKLQDKWLMLSRKPAGELTSEDKNFILERFFSINREKVTAMHPRFYELNFKKERREEFSLQDLLDLQVWFNLSWIDPEFRKTNPLLKQIVDKGRFFTEEEKNFVLDTQLDLLSNIIPSYKEAAQRGQVELTVSPYYHPILPLIYSTQTAREANMKTVLPKHGYSYPQDVKGQIGQGLSLFQSLFGFRPEGMWPSEQSISEHIIPYLIESGIKWMVLDEGILFKSLRKKKRDTLALYQPHLLKRKAGQIAVVFRDRNLSDLLGFTYHRMKSSEAVADFMQHLQNISTAFGKEDVLVTIAMDGENAWEYYDNDGHDFLNELYARLSESNFIKPITVSEYLRTHPTASEIKRIAAGSWIYSNFNKWMNHPLKARAWELLAEARSELSTIGYGLSARNMELAWKQIYILEGSDWFWWFGEDPDGSFDALFRTHMSNFYTLLNKEIPQVLKNPLTT